MYVDEKAEDGVKKETRPLDPSLVDEEGTHPKKAAQDVETVLLEQEQRDEEMDEEPGGSGSWQTFKTP